MVEGKANKQKFLVTGPAGQKLEAKVSSEADKMEGRRVSRPGRKLINLYNSGVRYKRWREGC